MRKFIFILSLLMCGCATTLGFYGNKFESSLSPCVDGILVNIDYYGCKKLHTQIIPGTSTVRVTCEERIADNHWTMGTFYFVPSVERFSRDDWLPVCGDSLHVVFFVESHAIIPNDDDGSGDDDDSASSENDYNSTPPDNVKVLTPGGSVPKRMR